MNYNIPKASNDKIGLDNFSIITKFESDYHTKIHEALLIKKHTPVLTDIYAGGVSFLLQCLNPVYTSCF